MCFLSDGRAGMCYYRLNGRVPDVFQGTQIFAWDIHVGHNNHVVFGGDD